MASYRSIKEADILDDLRRASRGEPTAGDPYGLRVLLADGILEARRAAHRRARAIRRAHRRGNVIVFPKLD